MPRLRRSHWLLLGAVVVAGCLCLQAAAYLALRLRLAPWAVHATPTGIPTPAVEASSARGTARALAAAVVPPRDSRALAQRLRPSVGSIPEIVNAEPPRHAVGDRARFWVSNSDTLEVFQITATLRAVSTYSEMWVQDGVAVDQKGLDETATVFDNTIYPSVHRYFGSEWSPGVDNNSRVVVLNARFSGAAGYYSSHDEFSRQVNPYSNEREMFYMNVTNIVPGAEQYSAVLAHEFQHMVHWRLDSNEDSWVNEGASELSARLASFGDTWAMSAFARRPDTQLNAWTLSPDEEPQPHYGASYLWMEYVLQRLGPEALKAVLAEPANGIEGFERVLAARAGSPSFDELFADWVLANLLDDTSAADERYAYQLVDPRVRMQATHRQLPAQESGSVSQYGTDYVALDSGKGPVKVEFWGDTSVAVVPNSPQQGSYEWWSNRGDMSNTTLTRAFDLSGVTKATLRYAVWYELEDGWDYGYVEVSTNGGATWTPLRTARTVDYNPNGNAFGPGYTGASGHPPGSKSRLKPAWVNEQIDLAPYAGQRILIRFETITDDAVNLPGMCLDSIAIPEIGYSDDAETEAGGWQAEGFVRMDNLLPQRFLVQVVEQGAEIQIRRLELDERQHGTLLIEDSRDLSRVVLAISGLTRHTTEPARYRYSLSRATN